MDILVHPDTFQPFEVREGYNRKSALAGHVDFEFCNGDESLFVRTAVYRFNNSVAAVAFPTHTTSEKIEVQETVKGVTSTRNRVQTTYHPSVEPSDTLREKIRQFIADEKNLAFAGNGQSSWAPADGGNVVAVKAAVPTAAPAAAELAAKDAQIAEMQKMLAAMQAQIAALTPAAPATPATTRRRATK